jgi:hypothetical protein
VDGAVVIRVGVRSFSDDSGLDWLAVVASTDHGDAVFAVEPWSEVGGPGERAAQAHADALIGHFEVLGIEARHAVPDWPGEPRSRDNTDAAIAQRERTRRRLDGP